MDARDLEGRTWTVRRRWLPRWEGRGVRSRLRQSSARRQRREREGKRGWLDWLDIPFFDDLGGIVAGIALFVVVVVLVLWGVPLLLAAIDLVVVLVALTIGVISRVVFRRPWTVEACADDGTIRTERVVGYRAAGRVRKAWASELRHGRSQEGGADGSRLLT